MGLELRQAVLELLLGLDLGLELGPGVPEVALEFPAGRAFVLQLLGEPGDLLAELGGLLRVSGCQGGRGWG